MLRSMRMLHHGGALLVVPNDESWRCSTHNDTPYLGSDNFTGMHEVLYELGQAENREVLEGIDIEVEEARQNSAMVAWWRRRLDDASADVAQLTAVDGATVVTRNLVVLGFGVKLLFSYDAKSLPIYVTDLLNPGEPNVRASINDLGGTRHQSAALFISKQHDATALVVSQDGSVSAFTWREAGEIAGAEKSGIYIYRHLELTL